MKRNTFLKKSLLTAGAIMTGKHLIAGYLPHPAPANKRERMLQWLEGKGEPGYTPAAFFLHFEEPYKVGSAATKKHIEYFDYTDMDFVKIQYEQEYTSVDFLKKPSDWSKVIPKKLDFYEPQLVTVRELVKAKKKDALIVMTLYSPFMWAGHLATRPELLKHMEENPDAVKKGLDALVESQMLFVRACIQIGVDGFYMSTQGSESGQLKDPRLFRDYVKPADLVAMKEVTSTCPFNILHVCDYNAPYTSYDAVLDYPGQIVNCNPQLREGQLSMKEISSKFKRPFMGGIDRHGVLTKGTPEQIEADVKRVLKDAPAQFMLGADCTVPGDMDWSRIRKAISVAHGNWG